MRSAIIPAIFTLFTSFAAAATIHVPPDYTKIQDAVNAAVNGDTVLVHPGTYVENIVFPAKDIVLISELGPSVTVIDGNQTGAVVDFATGVGTSTKMEGFSITNGKNDYGCGIVCRDNASPTITGNKIIYNTLWAYGGGIYCYNAAAPVITNNLIAFNTDGFTGGGIDCESGSAPIISGNTIIENKAVHGAGVYLAYCSAVVEDNYLSKNIAYANGGGIYVKGSSLKFTNNTFLLNQAASGAQAGGISCHGCPDLDIVHCTFYINKALTAGAIRSVNCQITIVNSIFWDNHGGTSSEIYLGDASNPSTLDISYSDVDGGQANVYVESGSTLNWGAGMIDADPLLVNPISYGDTHIKYSSPCRDAGDNSAPGLPAKDFEGDPRIAQGTADMGADEFHAHLYWNGNATPGGIVQLIYTGIPGSTPVQLWMGSGVMDPPWHTKYGDWYLMFPLLINIPNLGPMLPPDGIKNMHFTLDPTTPTPLSLPLQGGVGSELTNLSIMKIE